MATYLGAGLSAGTQQRGPITDHFGKGPKVRVHAENGHRYARLALCVCKHGVEWPEGGHGCEECIAEAHRERVA